MPASVPVSFFRSQMLTDAAFLMTSPSTRNVVFAERPRAKRGTYFIQTWGCQMNEEDSEQMGLYLEGIGFSKTENLLEAQVILLNTCSVRRKPEDKAFSLLGELEPLRW